MVKKKGEVLIPEGKHPKKQEKTAAWILAEHYEVTVQFLRERGGYREKTPDFLVGDTECELKTPESSKVDKIMDRIHEASFQADVVIVDSRKTKLTDKRMVEISKQALVEYKTIKKIILITKSKVQSEKVLEFIRE
jgi:hypothetical protein